MVADVTDAPVVDIDLRPDTEVIDLSESQCLTDESLKALSVAATGALS